MRSPAVAEKLLARIAWWERYTARNGMQMDNNPSAGNKAGGLTTILEKSLGAIAKSGTTPLHTAVLLKSHCIEKHARPQTDGPNVWRQWRAQRVHCTPG